MTSSATPASTAAQDLSPPSSTDGWLAFFRRYSCKSAFRPESCSIPAGVASILKSATAVSRQVHGRSFSLHEERLMLKSGAPNRCPASPLILSTHRPCTEMPEAN
ncbi:hypothetical protein HPP92_022611 [Vanilla planifolia]|uniref:Uncharacterized protein n=1 Tax=Vanilla planifolia TaxID=51239 RepID=A0A835PYL3_VANPL|nr:hypothetical protein HPP92_022896 [Vanilla planifolia]KAG0459483.1 hypothetical protein HPP92_022611 [Vanilla planifolia]